MKFCEKCGKEIADEILECPNCSIMPLYEQALKNAKTMNIVSIALIVVGVICALFVNAWLGAIVCFVAEIVCLIPNTKVQKLFKKNNVGTSDKKKLKSDSKALIKDLKTNNKSYKLSFLVAVIALILLIAFVCVDSALTGLANSLPSDLQKDDYGSGIVNQIDSIVDLHQYANSDFYNYAHNSSENSSNQSGTSSNNSSSYAKEPIVGSFDYSHSVYLDTMSVATIQTPYINHIKFDADGTGNVTIKTDGVSQFVYYDATWSIYDEQENITIYLVTLDNGEVGYVYYAQTEDICFMVVNNQIANYYNRY